MHDRRIEELAKRIAVNSYDAIDCIHAAERLIREDVARSGGPNDFATALFVLWRQGEIECRTMPDGTLGFYKPYVQ